MKNILFFGSLIHLLVFSTLFIRFVISTFKEHHKTLKLSMQFATLCDPHGFCKWD